MRITFLSINHADTNCSVEDLATGSTSRRDRARRHLPEAVVLLVSMLLVATVAPAVFAQQSAEVNSDPHVNVEVPNRSVQAVDLDPEKAKQDAAAPLQESQKLQKPYSTWGMQNPRMNDAVDVKRQSTWTLQSKPASITATNTDNPPQDVQPHGEPNPLKAVTRRAGKTRLEIPKYQTAAGLKRQSGFQSSDISGIGGTASEATFFDPSSALVFNPMKNFSAVGRATSQGEVGHHLSHSQVEEYCHASIMNDELKRRCAQWQKKSESHSSSSWKSASRRKRSKTKF